MSLNIRELPEWLNLISISGKGRTSGASSTATGSRGVSWCALISHFRVVTVLPISSVTYDLHTTIRKRDSVLSPDHITIAGCLVRVLVGGLGVAHGVVEVEGHSRFMDMLWTN